MPPRARFGRSNDTGRGESSTHNTDTRPPREHHEERRMFQNLRDGLHERSERRQERKEEEVIQGIPDKLSKVRSIKSSVQWGDSNRSISSLSRDIGSIGKWLSENKEILKIGRDEYGSEASRYNETLKSYYNGQKWKDSTSTETRAKALYTSSASDVQRDAGRLLDRAETLLTRAQQQGTERLQQRSQQQELERLQQRTLQDGRTHPQDDRAGQSVPLYQRGLEHLRALTRPQEQSTPQEEQRLMQNEPAHSQFSDTDQFSDSETLYER